MFENGKCCVATRKDGGRVVPHDPDGWTESVQCDQPIVALEAYANFDDTTLPVCAGHRHLIQMVRADFEAFEARRKRPTLPDRDI